MTYTRFILHCVSEGSKIKNVAMNVSTSNQKEFLWPFRSLCQLRTIFLFLISLFLVSWRDERFLKSRSDFRRTWKMWNEQKKCMILWCRLSSAIWPPLEWMTMLYIVFFWRQFTTSGIFFLHILFLATFDDVFWRVQTKKQYVIAGTDTRNAVAAGALQPSSAFSRVAKGQNALHTHTHRTQRADRHFCILFCFGTFKLIAQHLHFCHFVIYSRRYMGRRQWILILNSVYAFSILSLHFILYGLFAMNVEYAYHKQ